MSNDYIRFLYSFFSENRTGLGAWMSKNTNVIK